MLYFTQGEAGAPGMPGTDGRGGHPVSAALPTYFSKAARIVIPYYTILYYTMIK